MNWLIILCYKPQTLQVYNNLLKSVIEQILKHFGASTALGRFYFDEDSDKYRKEIVSSALFVTMGGAFLLIILSFLFGEYLSILLFDSSVYRIPLILAFSGASFGFLLNTMTLLLR